MKYVNAVLCLVLLSFPVMAADNAGIADFEDETTILTDGVRDRTVIKAEKTSDDKISGDKSLKVSYTIKKDGDYAQVQFYLPETQDWSQYTFLTLAVKGFEKAHDRLDVMAVEEDGDLWRYSSYSVLNNTEWQVLNIPLNTLEDEYWDFNNDPGERDLSRIVGMRLQVVWAEKDPGVTSHEGTIYFDRVMLSNTPATLESIFPEKTAPAAPQGDAATDIKPVQNFEGKVKFDMDHPAFTTMMTEITGKDASEGKKSLMTTYTIEKAGYYVQVNTLFLPEIQDWSKYEYLVLDVKGFPGCPEQFHFTFFEEDGDWWTYMEPYALGSGKWQMLHLPLKRFEDNPWDYNDEPGEMDLSKIKGFQVMVSSVKGPKGMHSGVFYVDRIFLTNAPAKNCVNVKW